MSAPILRVALPSPLRRLFDYRAPHGVDPEGLQPGVRVRVPFGRRELVGEDPLQFALRDRFSWITLVAMGAIGWVATSGLPITA